MRKLAILNLLILLLFAFGCNKVAVPVEISKACVDENDRKYVEVSGFFYPPEKVMCSNVRNRGVMRCEIQLRETPPGVTYLLVEIEEGRGSNNFEKPEKFYSPDFLRISDNKGGRVKFSDKVWLTGQMHTGASPCYMTVTKIARESTVNGM